MLWSDEKKFNMNGSDGRVYVRRAVSEEFKPNCLQGTVRGGGNGSIMAWACFSANGPGPLIKLTGNVDRFAYIDLIDTVVAPYLGEDMIFQHDNAPVHKARDVKDFLKEKNINVMDWPPQSPDLNPIENMWTAVDIHIKEHKPKNLAALEKVAKEAWENLNVEKCQKLIKSMKSRCKAVIRNLGYPTRY